MYEARAAHARAAKQARLEESQQFSLSISTSTVAVESQQDSREEIVTDRSVEHEGEMSGAGEPESSDSEGMGSDVHELHTASSPSQCKSRSGLSQHRSYQKIFQKGFGVRKGLP